MDEGFIEKRCSWHIMNGVDISYLLRDSAGLGLGRYDRWLSSVLWHRKTQDIVVESYMIVAHSPLLAVTLPTKWERGEPVSICLNAWVHESIVERVTRMLFPNRSVALSDFKLVPQMEIVSQESPFRTSPSGGYVWTLLQAKRKLHCIIMFKLQDFL